MKIHPLVWLGILDHLQRQGKDPLGLYGPLEPPSALTVFDLPLQNGLFNRNYIVKKIRQLDVVSEDCVLLGLVVPQEELHSIQTQKLVAEFPELVQNRPFFVLAVSAKDFERSSGSDGASVGKFRSRAYCFRDGALEPEKIVLEALGPEKATVNSVVDNEGTDSATLLKAHVDQHRDALGALSLKIDLLVDYLDGDVLEEVVGKIANVVGYLEGEPGLFERVFEEKLFSGVFGGVLGLAAEGVLKSSAVIEGSARMDGDVF